MDASVTGKRVGYGWFYNWYAVDAAEGIAPAGWRVPSIDDFDDMAQHILDNYDYDEDDLGGALKSTKNEWLNPNVGATDEFGFSILPSGFREDEFYLINNRSGIWLSDEYDDNKTRAWGSFVFYNIGNLGRANYAKERGLNVRCIQEKGIAESDKDKGTLTDVDGNTYGYVVIGDYRWMSENLRTTRFANGDDIPEYQDPDEWINNEIPMRCAYDNDIYYVYPPGKPGLVGYIGG
jgi:uncharacterized protein (TIGR02145 family)